MTAKGAGPLMWVAPVLEIGEERYPLRRLGLMDIEALTSIVVGASRYVDRKLIGGLGKLSAQQLGSFVIEYLPNAFDEIVAFLATVIGLDPGFSRDVVEKKRDKSKAKEFTDPNLGTIRDPNVFPLGSEVKLITLLTEHQDVLNFFDSGVALMGSGIVKKLIGPLKEPSTESSPDTDGPTNISPDED